MPSPTVLTVKHTDKSPNQNFAVIYESQNCQILQPKQKLTKFPRIVHKK